MDAWNMVLVQWSSSATSMVSYSIIYSVSAVLSLGAVQI